ncbi:MAG TPA: hypothetical protein VG308_17220 [Stellaceae bacterium]|nr:hypothetical protein [Stellaceae bacterium]
MSISTISPALAVIGKLPRPQRGPVPLIELPAIRPGQLWLVEAAADAPSQVARHALDAAHVVVYDRALADTVAHGLPLGSYAEPAAAHEAAASRCVRFARDGWSVARLVPAHLPQRERTRRLQDFVDELAAAKVPGSLPVLVLTEAADGTAEQFEARFDDIASIVATHPSNTRLAIAIDAFGGGAPTRLHAAAANGLAG